MSTWGWLSTKTPNDRVSVPQSVFLRSGSKDYEIIWTVDFILKTIENEVSNHLFSASISNEFLAEIVKPTQYQVG